MTFSGSFFQGHQLALSSIQFIFWSKNDGTLIIFVYTSFWCGESTQPLQSTQIFALQEMNENDTFPNFRLLHFVNYTIFYIKVHMATRWTIRHGLMLIWFKSVNQRSIKPCQIFVPWWHMWELYFWKVAHYKSSLG